MDFYYFSDAVDIQILFNNLMENPFVNDDEFFSVDHTSDVPCFLNQFVFRNTYTNEIFQAEYGGACESDRVNSILITMNLRDFLRMVRNEFIDTTSTMPVEMYSPDMLGAPFNLRIEPNNAILCDLRLNLHHVFIYSFDYWTDEGILLIHFNAFIDVATVNASKLSLSRDYYQDDINDLVYITGGEVLNQSPGLTSSVAIRLTSSDLALVASTGICTGSDGNFIDDCYLDTKSGFATAYYGIEVDPTASDTYFSYFIDKIRTASTGEHNYVCMVAFSLIISLQILRQ